MRGEKEQSNASLFLYTGSPPHARGKAPRPRAGGPHSWDHPRMRGEKLLGDGVCGHLKGSPPHARGKAKRRCRAWRRIRITPACAGKSRPRCTRSDAPRDHPRMRGEKPFYASDTKQSEGSPPHARGKVEHSLRAADVLGSPPHARGKVHLQRFHGQIHGITPACAGKRCNP